MKNLNLLLFVLILGSCGKGNLESNSRNCLEVEYNSSFDVKLSDEVCFPDGNSMTLTNIQNQFCPCDAICKWEGDLRITLTSKSENTTTDKEFYPSYLHNDRSIFDNHEITSFSYIYGKEGEAIPPCVEDFDPEKMVLKLNISPL